jgi:hypothetical protein
MSDKIPVTFKDNSPAVSEQDKLDNKAKTSLRERSMKSENNYPGIDR